MAAVASRYARALVEVILEQKIDGDVARQQLRAFVDAVHESLELRRVWESPAVLPEQKRAVLDAITDQIGAVKPIRNFMAVIIDHRRLKMLDDIVRVFETELDAQLGFAGSAGVERAAALAARAARGGIACGTHDGQESSRKLCVEPGVAGGSCGARWRHDLRRLGARTTGEDAARAEHGLTASSRQLRAARARDDNFVEIAWTLA